MTALRLSDCWEWKVPPSPSAWASEGCVGGGQGLEEGWVQRKSENQRGRGAGRGWVNSFPCPPRWWRCRTENTEKRKRWMPTQQIKRTSPSPMGKSWPEFTNRPFYQAGWESSVWSHAGQQQRGGKGGSDRGILTLEPGPFWCDEACSSLALFWVYSDNKNKAWRKQGSLSCWDARK